jgi:transposase InsO family protein
LRTGLVYESYVPTKEYGRPLELLTDHGSQFYTNFGKIKAFGISKFQQYLIDAKINHILGRVRHPQTNSKIERFYETFQSKYSILILWRNL